MSTVELKNKLIEKIQSTNDEHLLRVATRLMELQLNDLETPYPLTDDMEKAIGEAKAQIKNGIPLPM